MGSGTASALHRLGLVGGAGGMCCCLLPRLGAPPRSSANTQAMPACLPASLLQVEVHPYHRNDALIAFCLHPPHLGGAAAMSGRPPSMPPPPPPPPSPGWSMSWLTAAAMRAKRSSSLRATLCDTRLQGGAEQGRQRALSRQAERKQVKCSRMLGPALDRLLYCPVLPTHLINMNVVCVTSTQWWKL